MSTKVSADESLWKTERKDVILLVKILSIKVDHIETQLQSGIQLGIQLGSGVVQNKVSKNSQLCNHLILANITDVFLFGFIPILLVIINLKNLISNTSWLNFNEKTQFKFLVLVFPIIILISIFVKKFSERNGHDSKHVTIVVFVIVILIQLFMVIQLSTEVGWDCGAVINAAFGRDTAASSEYLSIYPNNAFLTYVYRIWFSLLGAKEANRYLLANILNIVAMNISAVFLYHIANEFFGKKEACVTMYYFLLLIGISPWLVIPYSDITSMPFVLGLFVIYIRLEGKGEWSVLDYAKYSVVIGLTLFAGLKIKPTVIVVFVAILIFSVAKKKKNQLIILSLSLVIFFVCNFGFGLFWQHQHDFKINDSKAVPFTHYLMLGVNDNMGCYTEEDLGITQSGNTQQDKIEINVHEIKKRLVEMGVAGYAENQWGKICQIHSEGNFFWGGEGGMNFMNFDLTRNEEIRNIFYINGSKFEIYKYLVQGVWMSLLFMIGLNVLSFWTEEERNDKGIIFLSIFGIIMFNLLFESRSRYLITYLPFYCMAAVRGKIVFGRWYKKHKKF